MSKLVIKKQLQSFEKQIRGLVLDGSITELKSTLKNIGTSTWRYEISIRIVKNILQVKTIFAF